MAHGTQNLRQEILAYANIAAVKNAGPEYLGLVSDDNEDGWMLGLWRAVDDAPLPAPEEIIPHMIAWQKETAGIENLSPAASQNYIRFFFEDRGKWKRLRDDSATREKFITLFVDPAEAAGWLETNIHTLCAWQEKTAGVSGPEGLIHGDLRRDNTLFDGARVYTIDWPNACRGPLLFDLVFLFSNFEMLGLGRMEEFFRFYRNKCGPDFSNDDLIALLAGVSGYFADQAYRAVPARLPRLRWMQKGMLFAQLRLLAALGVVTPLPRPVL